MTECYCVGLRKAARRISDLYDEALAPTGVNVAQFSLLRNIERRAPVSLTELGHATALDRSTIGRNIRVLERMGLVRTNLGADHRETTIVLAPAGRRVLEEGAPLWTKAQRRIETALGEDGATALRRLLTAI
jgi:DNA-binding MarR family transcriptional regulator